MIWRGGRDDSKVMSSINSLSESIGGTKHWRRIGAVEKPIGKLSVQLARYSWPLMR